MSKSTTIITTTTALSDIATAIAADAARRTPSKQHILNTFARGIAGPKHDWGFLTGAAGPVIQKGIPDCRLADIAAASSAPEARQVRAREDRSPLEITAEPAPLFEPEMAAYFGQQLSGDLLTICEDFSTDTENQHGVQCMFEPVAIFAREDTLSLAPQSLWCASPQLIEAAGRAYFAASSSARVNALISKTILDWPEEARTTEFKAFHFAHAIVVTTSDPFDTLVDRAREEGEDAPDADILPSAIRIFVDKALSADMRAQTLTEVESILNRLATFLGCADSRFDNIAVR